LSDSGTHLTRGVEESGEVAFEPTWTNRNEIEGISPFPGVVMQCLTGGKLMTNWVTIEPNREIPRHNHPHEQMGFVLQGHLELTIGDETRLLGPDDAYTIPPNLPHAARTHDDGCLVIDIFTPPREDYRRLGDES
jgi:quercetin dioxygenase-like cupin family protein